ncbi:hypothetical protein ABH924_004415 [Arthrobacter sp. GAS37]|uniref:hypothetical protein n=1 Tax=Arthrobacter sp. GAS37 TaxID=3156261 RepID=UPI003836DBB9
MKTPSPATSRHTPVRAVAVLAIVGAAFLLTGCIPSAAPAPTTTDAPPGTAAPTATATASPTANPNGIEKLNGADIIGQSLTNSLETKSVHLTGSYTAPAPKTAKPATPSPSPGAGTQAVTVDLTGSATTFKATFIIGTSTVELRRLDNDVYMKTNQQAAAQLGEPRLAKGFLKYGPGDAMVKSWLALTDAPTMLKTILQANVTGLTYTAGSITTAGNDPAIQVLITENSRLAGTLLVATTGKPFPLKLTMADDTGTADFTYANWGLDPAVSAPAVTEMAPAG